jgi:hypothetical protein
VQAVALAAVRRMKAAAIRDGDGAPSAAAVLRLLQIGVLGALWAALAAEFAAASAAQRASPLNLLAPPAEALHPFLPVFVGMLVLPLLIAALALALGHLYRAVSARTVTRRAGLFAVLAVAVRGAVPVQLALALLALPYGEAAVMAGAALSVLAWAGGYARVLGVRAGHGAQWFGIGALAALGVFPMVGALLAALA